MGITNPSLVVKYFGFPTVTVGFQSLRLGVVRLFLVSSGKNTVSLQPWNLLLGGKAGFMFNPISDDRPNQSGTHF